MVKVGTSESIRKVGEWRSAQVWWVPMPLSSRAQKTELGIWCLMLCTWSQVSSQWWEGRFLRPVLDSSWNGSQSSLPPSIHFLCNLSHPLATSRDFLLPIRIQQKWWDFTSKIRLHYKLGICVPLKSLMCWYLEMGPLEDDLFMWTSALTKET